MKLPRLPGPVQRNRRVSALALVATLGLAWLMFFRLGSLTGGLSPDEVSVSSTPVGLHAVYQNVFYLPLNIARSIVFAAFTDHGPALTRLPNVVFGALAVVSFGGLIRLWHGARVAVLATAMFATAAWTLHVSRFVSWDVMYLWAMPTLMFSHFLLRRYHKRPLVAYASLVVWGLLLYVPGMVWLIVADIVIQRKYIVEGLRSLGRWWRYVLYAFLGLIWLPLLALQLSRPGGLRLWLGLPSHFETVAETAKHFAAVPLHLFVRGPEYPQIWLGKSPILDVFTLALCIIGVYFYLSRWRSPRAVYLMVVAVIGFVLVGIGGPVPLSLLVPLLYAIAATGLAYLLHEWLKTFPNNPLARGLGLGLLVLAVFLSCVYNYRAYFIAWPHASATKTVFQYRHHP